MTYRVPGKLLLFGEHAAVYGYPAVGIALDRGLAISIAQSTGEPPTPERRDSRPLITVEGGGTDILEALRHFEDHLRLVVETTDAATLPEDQIVVSPELPIGSGFGSSAALCTAIARAVMPRDTEASQIWRVAHRLETFFHGTPSGIDTGLTTFGGALAFHFGRSRLAATTADSETNANADTSDPGLRPLPQTTQLTVPPLYLVVASIPRERSTKELVAGVRRRFERDPQRIGPLLDRLGRLSEQCITATSAPTVTDQRLTEGRSGEPSHHRTGEKRPNWSFPDAVRDAQSALQQLGVSTPATEELIETGIKAGAQAGKISGAGGGGAFYLVCPDSKTVDRVQEALSPQVHALGGVLFKVSTRMLKKRRDSFRSM